MLCHVSTLFCYFLFLIRVNERDFYGRFGVGARQQAFCTLYTLSLICSFISWCDVAARPTYNPLPSPRSSFSCSNSWTRCVFGPMTKGRHPCHNTKGRGNKNRHWCHSVLPVGPSLCLWFHLVSALPAWPPSSPPDGLTTGLQAPASDAKTAALQTLINQLLQLWKVKSYTHTCMCTSMYIYMCTYIYTHTYVYMHGCMCVYICICIYICISRWFHFSVWTLIYPGWVASGIVSCRHLSLFPCLLLWHFHLLFLHLLIAPQWLRAMAKPSMMNMTIIIFSCSLYFLLAYLPNPMLTSFHTLFYLILTIQCKQGFLNTYFINEEIEAQGSWVTHLRS